jgi:hypothetical protein
MLLDQPETCGTSDAFENERRLPKATGRADERLLQLLAVEERVFRRIFPGRRPGVRRPEPVIVVEPASRDRFRDGPASPAAEVTNFPQDRAPPALTSRQR